MYAGQGSQRPGMGRDLYDRFSRFREVTDRAEQVRPGLKSLMFEDDGTLLSQTENTQPALAAFAAGVTAVLYEAGIRPDFAAGLSLGEYSALHAAGVFDADTLIRLTAFRGKVMQEAAAGKQTCMSAIVGLEAEQVRLVCEAASGHGMVSVANYNSPAQTVIAGEVPAVAKAEEMASEAGARRCIRLKVSSAFHTALMEPASEALHEYFNAVSFGKMQFPVIFNTTGRPIAEPETIPGLLERQVKSSVRMTDTIRYLAEEGVDQVIEIGPGTAISGFIRKTDRRISVISIDKAEDLCRAMEIVKAR